MMNATCRNCGSQVPDVYRFCLECGVELRGTVDDEQTLLIPNAARLMPTMAASPMIQSVWNEEVPPSDGRLRWFLAGAGSLVLMSLVGLVILAWVWTQDAATARQTSVPAQSKPAPSPTATPVPTPTPVPTGWVFMNKQDGKLLYYKPSSLVATGRDSGEVWIKAVSPYETSDGRGLLGVRCKTSLVSVIQAAQYGSDGQLQDATLRIPESQQVWVHPKKGVASNVLADVCPRLAAQAAGR